MADKLLRFAQREACFPRYLEPPDNSSRGLIQTGQNISDVLKRVESYSKKHGYGVVDKHMKLYIWKKLCYMPGALVRHNGDPIAVTQAANASISDLEGESLTLLLKNDNAETVEVAEGGSLVRLNVQSSGKESKNNLDDARRVLSALNAVGPSGQADMRKSSNMHSNDHYYTLGKLKELGLVQSIQFALGQNEKSYERADTLYLSKYRVDPLSPDCRLHMMSTPLWNLHYEWAKPGWEPLKVFVAILMMETLWAADGKEVVEKEAREHIKNLLFAEGYLNSDAENDIDRFNTLFRTVRAFLSQNLYIIQTERIIEHEGKVSKTLYLSLRKSNEGTGMSDETEATRCALALGIESPGMACWRLIDEAGNEGISMRAIRAELGPSSNKLAKRYPEKYLVNRNDVIHFMTVENKSRAKRFLLKTNQEGEHQDFLGRLREICVDMLKQSEEGGMTLKALMESISSSIRHNVMQKTLEKSLTKEIEEDRLRLTLVSEKGRPNIRVLIMVNGHPATDGKSEEELQEISKNIALKYLNSIVPAYSKQVERGVDMENVYSLDVVLPTQDTKTHLEREIWKIYHGYEQSIIRKLHLLHLHLVQTCIYEGSSFQGVWSFSDSVPSTLPYELFCTIIGEAKRKACPELAFDNPNAKKEMNFLLKLLTNFGLYQIKEGKSEVMWTATLRLSEDTNEDFNFNVETYEEVIRRYWNVVNGMVISRKSNHVALNPFLEKVAPIQRSRCVSEKMEDYIKQELSNDEDGEVDRKSLLISSDEAVSSGWAALRKIRKGQTHLNALVWYICHPAQALASSSMYGVKTESQGNARSKRPRQPYRRRANDIPLDVAVIEDDMPLNEVTQQWQVPKMARHHRGHALVNTGIPWTDAMSNLMKDLRLSTIARGGNIKKVVEMMAPRFIIDGGSFMHVSPRQKEALTAVIEERLRMEMSRDSEFRKQVTDRFHEVLDGSDFINRLYIKCHSYVDDTLTIKEERVSEAAEAIQAAINGRSLDAPNSPESSLLARFPEVVLISAMKWLISETLVQVRERKVVHSRRCTISKAFLTAADSPITRFQYQHSRVKDERPLHGYAAPVMTSLYMSLRKPPRDTVIVGNEELVAGEAVQQVMWAIDGKVSLTPDLSLSVTNKLEIASTIAVTSANDLEAFEAISPIATAKPRSWTDTSGKGVKQPEMQGFIHSMIIVSPGITFAKLCREASCPPTAVDSLLDSLVSIGAIYEREVVSKAASLFEDASYTLQEPNPSSKRSRVDPETRVFYCRTSPVH